jgi:hypothetical protein
VGCRAEQSRKSLLTFETWLLLPSPGRWLLMDSVSTSETSAHLFETTWGNIQYLCMDFLTCSYYNRRHSLLYATVNDCRTELGRGPEMINICCRSRYHFAQATEHHLYSTGYNIKSRNNKCRERQSS